MANQLGVGFGAYKFQTIISNEMKNTRDSTHRTRIQTESRRSVQEKCKQQFQNAKKRIKEKLSDPNERERFHTLIQLDSEIEQNDDDLEPQTLMLLEHRKKNEKEFVLEVSDSSSTNSADSSMSGTNEQIQENICNPSTIYEEENQLAGQNLKSLRTPSIIRSPQVSQTRAQVAKQKLKTMKAMRPPIIRKDIKFLRSLCQNENFINNDKATLDEFKLDREIVVEMDCQDIITFMRLQHEVEEMRRKQFEFTQQKERHYEVTKKEKTKSQSKEQTKTEDNKIWTVMMAKRFIKNMKLKKDQPTPPQKHIISTIIRKSTRGSTIKTLF